MSFPFLNSEKVSVALSMRLLSIQLFRNGNDTKGNILRLIFYDLVHLTVQIFCILSIDAASKTQGRQSWGGMGGDTSPPIFRVGGTNI